MNSPLPPTGTAQLFALLDPHVPDAFIDENWNRRHRRGLHRSLSAAELWRLYLLADPTTSHSFNPFVALLPEQGGWREFARLANRHGVPGVRNAQQVPLAGGSGGLRKINDSLRLLKTLPVMTLGQLLETGRGESAVALIALGYYPDTNKALAAFHPGDQA